MANFVQTLALLFAAASGFSHKVHLDQKLACTSCHIGVSGSKLPQAPVCKPCHDAAIVRTTPSIRFVKKFSHAAHSALINCQGCHRLAAGEANPGFPKMQFCIGCHNKIDPPDSCMKCHLPTQQLQPESHLAKDFFDLHSSDKMPTKNAGCAVCHGRSFTCQGCH